MGQASLAVTLPPDIASDPAFAALFAGPDGAEARAYWHAATGGALTGDPALDRRLAADILACRGQLPAAALRAARGPMLARAGSALRAEGAAPPPDPAAVALQATERPFRGFFAVETLTLTHRRHDGTPSAPLRREVFIGCDAVTVLPYDPARDRVLVIEQFRAGPLARGDTQPWQVEAIAGRIDAADTPEATARREAQEEAGLELGPLLPVAAYYPSPGAVSEYIHSFVALTDLPDGTGGLHGLADEHEDILSRVLPFATAMDWLSAGRIGNAPLILTLLWLDRERPRLRAAAAQPGGGGSSTS